MTTLLALLLRHDFQLSFDQVEGIGPHLLLTMLIIGAASYVSGVYRSIWRYTSSMDYLKIMGLSAVAVVGAMALGFVVDRLQGVPRSLPLLQFFLMTTTMCMARFVAKLRFQARSRRVVLANRPESVVPAVAQQGVLIVGLSLLTDVYLHSIREFAPDYIKVIGLLGRQDRHTGRVMHGIQILGTPEQVVDVLRDQDVHGVRIDRIVVAVPFESLSPAARAALLDVERTSDTSLEFVAESLGLQRPAPRAISVPETPQSDGCDTSGVMLSKAEQAIIAQRAYWSVKRTIDFAAAAVLIITGLPLVILVGLIVAIDLGLPTVFWQQRPGVGGDPFRLYKFRTMIAAHDKHGRRVPDDQRSSAVGHMLRRTRLDELPQLYNILIGDMSFVGPRPLLPVDQPSGSNPRLLVRPGLTGWAQVNGGRVISMLDKTALDMWYLRHASLRLDLRILLRTVVMVLRGERRDEGAILKAYSELSLSATSGVIGPRRAGECGP